MNIQKKVNSFRRMIYQTAKFNQPSRIERLQAAKQFFCLYQKTLRNIKNGTFTTK